MRRESVCLKKKQPPRLRDYDHVVAAAATSVATEVLPSPPLKQGSWYMESAPGAAAFTKCCQDSGILMVVKCREENAALKECVTGYYNDPSFYEECKAEYLKQREEFRETGNRRKQQRLPTSM
uniref:COX assembly mitochondrial protein n=1 Tax=Podarcis muralis TaxID=64176 RepID=A0A670KAS2_PODMU